jgi:glycosyltransferase involved in cell wall biosynthesis
MKLLFVVSEYGPGVPGGIATYYRNLLPELARRGHEVRVVLADRGTEPLPDSAPGLTVTRVGPKLVGAEAGRFDAFAAIPALQNRLARARAAWRLAAGGEGHDLVETTDYNTLFVPWVMPGSRPPVLVQLHGSNGQLLTHDPIAGEELQASVSRLLETSLLGRADELQSYGGPNAREWSGLLGREVAHLWPAWRSAAEPPPAALPDGLDGLVVARVQTWKGPAVLCEALRQLGPDAPTVGWVGADTHYRQAGRWYGDYLAATYPDVWGRKVIPLGRRSPAETAALQAAARFVVVPSTWDVFNLAAVEAMGQGRVVVCSEGAGAAELIRDGETGFRCAAGDAAALSDRLRRVRELGDAGRRRVGEAARAAVAEALDPERVAGQRLSRYEALAKRQSRPALPTRFDLLGPEQVGGDPLAFLDGVPLRRLVRHAMRRAFDRFWKMLGR